MLVLHAAWAGASGEPGLLLWGEDAGRPARTSSRARVRPHPYAAPEPTLRDAVVALAGRADATAPGIDAALAKAEAGEEELHLPGSATHPLPSPALGPVAGAPRVATAQTRAWRVPTLRVPASAARGLVTMVPDRTGGDIAIGPGLRHLTAVARFSERLVTAGRLLPRLVGDPPEPRWRPVLAGADAEHLAGLVAALPPVARAHLGRSGEGAGDVVYGELCALLDAAARARLGPGPGGADQLDTALATVRPETEDATTGGGLATLAHRLRAWHREAERPRGRARLLFRLVEPDPGGADGDTGDDRASARAAGETWRVEFWVRSSADPSLQLPLRDLWLGEGGAWLPDDVETTVLADLRRAVRHYPAVEAALGDLAPDGITLGTGGAHAFIRDVAPRLTAAGFSVVLPEWVGQRSLGLRLTTRERPTGTGGGIGPADLVDFSFAAVLGDDTVDVAELAELARLKQHLVRVRGRWVEVDPGQLRTALDVLRRRGRGRMTRQEALRAALTPESTALPITGVDADGALGELLSGTVEHHLTPMAAPRGFTGTLRPYQQRGAAWLRFLGRLGLGAVLADDMGLGKTVQLLALLAEERWGDRDHPNGATAGTGDGPPGPTLLVCPVSLIGNWRREAERFTPDLRVHVQHGPSRPHGNALARAAGASDLVLTTYGVVLRDAEELAAMPWHRVVCDEAQAIKNSGTRQARAVRELPAGSRIALTGTPVENNLDELWSIMEFGNPGLLGPAETFRRAVAGRVEREAAGAAGSAHAGDQEAAREDADPAPGTSLVRRLTGPFILRRVKTDRSIVPDLPEKQEIRTWCTLTPEQATLYRAAVDDMTRRIDEADGIQRKGLVLATLARLKQICNHPAQFLGDGSTLPGRSGKLERLEATLTEALAAGDKALCFTQYTAWGDRLAPYLAARLGGEVLWLHGGTPRARREEMVRRFQRASGPAVFLLSLKAAGTGLNLTAANHVVHIDRWWNPAVEDQATDRAFRIGQRRDVQVHKLICVGTLEERVDEMIERKRALARSVVTTGEDWLTNLSTADLREVIHLSPEAVTP